MATKTLEGTALSRVHNIREAIAKGGDEAQQIRHEPQWLTDILIDNGIYRFALPRELGGEDADVRTTVEVLEAISAIDASIGWNVMLGSEINALAAGGMPKDLAKEVYIDNPRVVMCGGGGPGTQPSRAIKVPGGYQVWAQSTFMSGCHHSEWAFQSAPILENGQPIIEPSGMPRMKMFFIHKSKFEILDTWDVAGLRGSGSHDVKTDGAVIEDKWLPVELFQLPAQHANPVFRIPVPLRLSYNKAAVATGVALGALAEFADLAQNKTPFLSPGKLQERPIAQYRMGECVATIKAARAYLFEAFKAVEDELRAGASAPSGPTTQDARLACVFAANASVHVVDVIHNTAGTSAMRLNSPLERKLRDAHGAASHRWVSHSLYPELGKIHLGMAPSPEFAGGTEGPVLGGGQGAKQ
ncbi:MAG: acyl-CoA dehydrogenase family protein [Dehalococcoidia bacterium]